MSAPAPGTPPRCSTSSRPRVVSIERIPVLAARARRALELTGHRDVEVRIGDGSRSERPTVRRSTRSRSPPRPTRVPQALYEQLARRRPDGASARRRGRAAARPHRAHRGTGPVETASLACRFVPLVVTGARARVAPERPLRSAGEMDEGTVTTGRDLPRGRVDAALRRRANWEQLVKFCVVGAIGLRRQPRRLHAAARGRRAPLRPRGDRLVPRRGHEQLRVEPGLDVPRAARPRRAPGPAVPRRLDDRARARTSSSSTLLVAGRPRRGRRAGARDHARHAGQLRRQQAVVVPPPPPLTRVP